MSNVILSAPLAERPSRVSFSTDDSDTSCERIRRRACKGKSILKKGKYQSNPTYNSIPDVDGRQDERHATVSFDQKLFQVKEVENWKRYNVEGDFENKGCCDMF